MVLFFVIFLPAVIEGREARIGGETAHPHSPMTASYFCELNFWNYRVREPHDNERRDGDEREIE